MDKMTQTQKIAAVMGMAAALMPTPLESRWYGRRPPGRPCVKKLRAKRKVRNRMAKISRLRNRAG